LTFTLDRSIHTPIRSIETTEEATLRLARRTDAKAIDALMKSSASEIFPRFYSRAQAESAVRFVAQVEPSLVDDGTFFVLEADGELVGCGGWSRRNRLYAGSGEAADDARLLDPGTEPAKVRAMFVRADWTRRGLGRRILEECEAAARREGFRRLGLMATLPGLPLYEAYGFRPLQQLDVVLEDGTRLPCVSMELALD
jgi:GNAT superfamily N-acetyltransferase